MGRRKTAARAKAVLVGAGFQGLRHSDFPDSVLGVPFVTIRTKRMGPDKTGVFAQTDTIPILWTVTEEPEGHRVQLRAVDFAPMLLAWVESERSKR